MARGLCTYCGQERELTVDHVPPRSFFGTPPPADLITVPACAPCNGGFNVDDDYIRLVLASDERARGNAERNRILPAIVRYSQRRQARRSLRDFYDSLGWAYHTNPQGVTVWTQHHTIDGRRLDAFASRIVRALFFREKGFRVPDDCVVNTINWRRIPDVLMADGGELVAFVIEHLNEPERRQARGGVFAYSWLQSPNDDLNTWWMLEFYGSLEYVCSTWHPPPGYVAPTPEPV